MHGHWHGCGPRARIGSSRTTVRDSAGGAGSASGPAASISTSATARAARRLGPRRPRGRRRMFGSGELRLVLLKLIADEPRHGYDLIRAIEELTGGEYAPSPGVVYPTLTMLEDMGLIEEAGRRRIAQGLPGDRGRQGASRGECRGGRGPVRAARGAGARQATARGHPPIGRAVGNLMTALRHRVAHDGFDDDLVHEIAEILDEAAQRIERLK